MNRTPEELDAYMARLRKELEAVEQMKAEAVAQEQAAAQEQTDSQEQTTKSEEQTDSQEQATKSEEQAAGGEAFAQTYQRYISTQQFSEAFALSLENLKGEDKEQAEKRAKQALELMANSGVRRFALNPKVAISYEKITDGLQSKGYEDLRKRDTLEAGKAEVKIYNDGEKQHVVCKTRNYRHIVAIILAITSALILLINIVIVDFSSSETDDLFILILIYAWVTITILVLHSASSRRNRKRLFKDVGEIIIKANQ